MATRAKAHPDINRADLARKIDVDRGYLTKVLNGTRKAPLNMALAIFDATGLRIGPIAHAKETDIRAMRRALAAAQ